MFSQSPRLRLAVLYSSIIGGMLLGLGYITHHAIERVTSKMVDREIDLLSMAIHSKLEKTLKIPNILPSEADQLVAGICRLNQRCQPNVQDSLLLRLIDDDCHLELLDIEGNPIAAIGSEPGRFPKHKKFTSTDTVYDRQGIPYHLHHSKLTTNQGQHWGYLQVGRSVQKIDQYMAGLHWLIIIGVPITMLLIGVVSWWLAGIAMRPLYLSYAQMQRFTADASHELRTPIAAIKAILEVAIVENNQHKNQHKNQNHPYQIVGQNHNQTFDQGDQGDHQEIQEIQEILLTLQRQNDRMGQLAQDLLLLSQLDLAQIGSNGIYAENINYNQNQQVCLNELVEDLVEELAPLALASQVEITAQIHTSQTLYIFGNANQIYRVFSNLITNGIQYTEPNGMVEIHLFHQFIYHRGYANIIVKDNGIGISEANLAHLFDRFYRVKQDRSRKTGGMGLGLAIVKAIVENHKGQIEVKSQLGQGSSFSVRFPLQYRA